MNWRNKIRRTKKVHITFEWTEKSDLKPILDYLNASIRSGIESCHQQIKSLEIKDKWHNVEFNQEYMKNIHESTEREINGELKLVIKSNI